MNGQILNPKPEEINELHWAIHEYQNTIDRLKLNPGLKNYHKYYGKTLNTKFFYKREKELAKAHQLIPPGLGTDHNFNIYNFFLTKSKKLAIPISIIDTLIVSKKENTMIYLKNDSDGIITQTKGKEAFTQFIKKLTEKKNIKFPLCIYKPYEGKNCLFGEIENFIEFFSETNEIEGIFQEFILSSKMTSLLRIHWKHNKKLRGYLIGNIKKRNDSKEEKLVSMALNSKSKTAQDSFKEFKSEEALISNAHKIIAITESFFKPKNSIVSQMINLLSENFEQDCCVLDSQLLNSSGPINSLKDKIESTCYNPWNEKKKLEFYLSEDFSKKFIVTGRNPRNSFVTDIKIVYPQVKQITNQILALLFPYFSEQKKKLTEITIDFLKSDKNWVVLKSDKILLNEDFSSFKELEYEDLKNNTNLVIPTLPKQLKTEDQSKLKLTNIPSQRFDSPMLLKRTVIKTEPKLAKMKSTKLLRSNSLKKIEDNLNHFIRKVDNFSKLTLPNFNNNKEALVDSYEKHFSVFATGPKRKNWPSPQNLKAKGAKKITSLEDSQKIEFISANNGFQNTLKNYNSMMINVRRVNLQKKTPLIEEYGGDAVWNKIISAFESNLENSQEIMKYFDAKNKKSHQGIFCQSLDCVFNSNINLEFRRLVRKKHKHLNIPAEDFYLFGQIFIKTLKDFGILGCHLEIIHDNYNSFLAPITNKIT